MKAILLFSILLLFLVLTNAHFTIFKDHLERVTGNNNKLSSIITRNSFSFSDSFSCPSFSCGRTNNQSCNSQSFYTCDQNNITECDLCSNDDYCNLNASTCFTKKKVNESCSTNDECEFINPSYTPSCVHAYNSTQTTCQFVYQGFAGEKCGFNAGAPEISQCFGSLKCVDGICQGLALNELCNDTLECSQGLFCNETNYCVESYQIGEFCNSTLECFTPGKFLACDEQYHVCYEPYSKGLGENCTTSYECQFSELACIGGKCSNVSSEDFLIPCTSSDNCTFSNINFNSSCLCSISATESNEGQCYGPDSTYNAPKAQDLFNQFRTCVAANNCSTNSISCINVECGDLYWCTYLGLIDAGYFGNIASVELIDQCSEGIFGNLWNSCQLLLNSTSNSTSSNSISSSGSFDVSSNLENNVVLSGAARNSASFIFVILSILFLIFSLFF